MIINNPTGFYRSVIPPAVNNSGNYTYTISNGDPPRGSLFFFKINLKLAINSVPILATEPTGKQFSGTLKSFRSISSTGLPIRPVGTVIEFNDGLNKIDNVSTSLNQSTDFNRFNNDSIDPVNSKLRSSYQKFKDKLIFTVQELQNSYVRVGNLEREYNTYTASLEAVEQALLLEPSDSDLLSVRDELINKMRTNKITTSAIYEIINKLSDDKIKYEDAIRSLVKVIQ